MIEKYFRTKGTCSRGIRIGIDEQGILRKIEFEGGCPGNTIGVSKLALGRPAEEVADLRKGTRCGMKSTSCPDQLAAGIREALEELKGA